MYRALSLSSAGDTIELLRPAPAAKVSGLIAQLCGMNQPVMAKAHRSLAWPGHRAAAGCRAAVGAPKALEYRAQRWGWSVGDAGVWCVDTQSRGQRNQVILILDMPRRLSAIVNSISASSCFSRAGGSCEWSLSRSPGRTGVCIPDCRSPLSCV